MIIISTILEMERTKQQLNLKKDREFQP